MHFYFQDCSDRFGRVILALFLAVIALGSGCESSEDLTADEANKERKEETSLPNEPSAEKNETEDPPPNDLYEGMSFSALSEKQKILFVEVAKSELCPCDGSNQSLHGCLKEIKTQCSAAKRVGAMVAN